MELVIHDLPAKVWENLNKKAKVSGRSVEAEAAAILSASLKHDVGEMDDLQKMVFEMYRGNLPENEVDDFIADRRLEAKAEASKLS
jgi:plasmid stability protein